MRASGTDVRLQQLMPGGIPRWIRSYSTEGTDKETADCYTVVYTKRSTTMLADGNMILTSSLRRRGVRCRASGQAGVPWNQYVGMSQAPFNPQGFCQHGEAQKMIDKPTHSHLGRRIRFKDLPKDCQTVVLCDYKEIWNL